MSYSNGTSTSSGYQGKSAWIIDGKAYPMSEYTATFDFVAGKVTVARKPT